MIKTFSKELLFREGFDQFLYSDRKSRQQIFNLRAFNKYLIKLCILYIEIMNS